MWHILLMWKSLVNTYCVNLGVLKHTSGSTLRRYLFQVKPQTEFHMIKNCVYFKPCSCGKIYKGETGHQLKVRLEKHQKAVVQGEIEKSGMADHIWKEKGSHLPLWDKVEIINRAEHWRIRHLKESAHMLSYNDLLSRPNIELNTIWEPIIKKAIWKKKIWIWAQVKKKKKKKKKITHNSSNPSQVRTLSS